MKAGVNAGGADPIDRGMNFGSLVSFIPTVNHVCRGTGPSIPERSWIRFYGIGIPKDHAGALSPGSCGITSRGNGFEVERGDKEIRNNDLRSVGLAHFWHTELNLRRREACDPWHLQLRCRP